MIADIFTKPLCKAKHTLCTEGLAVKVAEMLVQVGMMKLIMFLLCTQ
jgi:hypothetical protein